MIGVGVPTDGERPMIRSVGEAAAELNRLYSALGAVAVDLTEGYVQERLQGKKDVTWRMFPPHSAFSRPTPILDQIMRHDGAVLLGAGVNVFNELLFEYELREEGIAVPSGSGRLAVVSDAITVHKPGRGVTSPEKYAVIGDGVLRVELDTTPPILTVQNGGLVGLGPRSRLSDKYCSLTQVDTELLRVIVDLQSFEPSVDG